MKSTIKSIYKPSGNYQSILQSFVLITIFGYLFAENFILSESWEVLPLRSIDDYAIQTSIRLMQEALLSGNWKRVFSFFDYAYGNAFWLFNSLLLLPLYFIGDAQILIVAGRQISLVFVFGSIFLIGLIIDRIRPDAGQLKYPVLIAIATMPMISIIATKLHVNAQSIFFGLLSYFFLIREPSLKKQSMLFSALFAGMSVGFKLTGVFMIPLLWISLINRLHQLNSQKSIYEQLAGNPDYRVREQILYFFILTVVAMACTNPMLLLFPFFIDELTLTYNSFILFKNMANTDVKISAQLLMDAFRFYLSSLGLIMCFGFFLVLVFYDIRQKLYSSFYILAAIIFTILFVIITVHKGPAYIATYMINLAFFIPIGLLGIGVLPFIPNKLKLPLAYSVVIMGLFYGTEQRQAILASYNFYAMLQDKAVQRQLLALEEMRQLIYPIKIPVVILQDSSSIFPATHFIDGVTVAINYGNLKEKSTWGTFDYILLNSSTYYGKKATPAEDDIEESTRNILHDTGLFYGKRYVLIYSGYDALLYKLESKQ